MSAETKTNEVEQMRERLIEFISWGETLEDGRIGCDTARQMMAIYDEAVAKRAAQSDEVAECGSLIPFTWHEQITCELPAGHGGDHWCGDTGWDNTTEAQS